MSDVPLPKPCIKGGELAEVSENLWDLDALRAYGDARAAEARRLALLEAADRLKSKHAHEVKGVAHHAGNWHEAEKWHMTRQAAVAECVEVLRALADEASPKSVSG